MSWRWCTAICKAQVQRRQDAHQCQSTRTAAAPKGFAAGGTNERRFILALRGLRCRGTRGGCSRGRVGGWHALARGFGPGDAMRCQRLPWQQRGQGRGVQAGRCCWSRARYRGVTLVLDRVPSRGAGSGSRSSLDPVPGLVRGQAQVLAPAQAGKFQPLQTQLWRGCAGQFVTWQLGRCLLGVSACTDTGTGTAQRRVSGLDHTDRRGIGDHRDLGGDRHLQGGDGHIDTWHIRPGGSGAGSTEGSGVLSGGASGTGVGTGTADSGAGTTVASHASSDGSGAAPYKAGATGAGDGDTAKKAGITTWAPEAPPQAQVRALVAEADMGAAAPRSAEARGAGHRAPRVNAGCRTPCPVAAGAAAQVASARQRQKSARIAHSAPSRPKYGVGLGRP